MSSLQDSKTFARLSIQRALLGQVSTQLRAVVLVIGGRSLDIKFYFDGHISEADLESASCVEAEIVADYEQDQSVSVQCIRLDVPESIANDGIWVYRRREPIDGESMLER